MDRVLENGHGLISVFGSPGSGKSHWIMSFLRENKGKFNRIIVFNPCSKLDKNFREFFENEKLVETNEKLKFLKEMEKYNESNPLRELGVDKVDNTTHNNNNNKPLKFIVQSFIGGKPISQIPEGGKNEGEIERKPILKKSKLVKISEEDIHTKYNPEILLNLFNEQEIDKNLYGENVIDNCLVIFDDVLSDNVLTSSMKSVLCQIFLVSRHVKMSFLLSSQRLIAIPPTLRESMSCFVAFQIGHNELKHLYDLLSLRCDFRQFKAFITQMFNHKYDHLIINKNLPHELKFNFKGKYFINYEG